MLTTIQKAAKFTQRSEAQTITIMNRSLRTGSIVLYVFRLFLALDVCNYSFRCIRHDIWWIFPKHWFTFKNTEAWNMIPNEMIHFYFFTFVVVSSQHMTNRTFRIEYDEKDSGVLFGKIVFYFIVNIFLVNENIR